MPNRGEMARLFSIAARAPWRTLVSTRASLQLLDAQLLFPDEGLPEFIDAEELRRHLPLLFDRFWDDYTGDRREMIDSIGDWFLSPILCDRITAAHLDPIARAVHGPHAKEWLLLCRLHTQCGVPLPRAHWLMEEVMRRVEGGNPRESLPNGYKLILSRAYHTALEGTCTRATIRFCPPETDGERWFVADRLAIVRSLVRAMLGCLLDDGLPRRPSGRLDLEGT